MLITAECDTNCEVGPDQNCIPRKLKLKGQRDKKWCKETCMKAFEQRDQYAVCCLGTQGPKPKCVRVDGAVFGSAPLFGFGPDGSRGGFARQATIYRTAEKSRQQPAVRSDGCLSSVISRLGIFKFEGKEFYTYN